MWELIPTQLLHLLGGWTKAACPPCSRASYDTITDAITVTDTGTVIATMPGIGSSLLAL